MNAPRIKLALRDIAVALLFWLIIVVTSLSLITITKQQHNRINFLQESHLIQSWIQNNLNTNEIIINHIADQVGPADLFQQKHIQSIIEKAISRYPHIRSVLLYPTVDHEEMGDLILLSGTLRPYIPTTILDDRSTIYSPIVLEYSKESGGPQLLGHDAREITALKGTIDTVSDHHPLSSLPYQIQDEQYYFLVANAKRGLNINDDDFPWYSKIQVAMVIDPNQMIPMDSPVAAILSLKNPLNQESKRLASIQHNTSDHLINFPLHYSARLDSMSQPFLLETSKNRPLITISTQTAILLSIFSALYFLLIIRLVMAKNVAEEQEMLSDTKLKINTNNRIQMMNAISHDIRTPLTRLQLRTKLLEKEQQEKIIPDLNEINQLVESSISFLHDQEQLEDPAICNINLLLESVQKKMEESGQHFTINGRAQWLYLCQITELKRAIQNLLNNAFHYGGKHINTHLSDTKQHIIIEVTDDGPGIEKALIDKVTRPYFRADESRNKNSGGIGLGLSIAHQVCEAHGGHLILRNRPEGGLSATIMLPR